MTGLGSQWSSARLARSHDQNHLCCSHSKFSSTPYDDDDDDDDDDAAHHRIMIVKPIWDVNFELGNPLPCPPPHKGFRHPTRRTSWWAEKSPCWMTRFTGKSFLSAATATQLITARMNFFQRGCGKDSLRLPRSVL